jgi:hypothetical protein
MKLVTWVMLNGVSILGIVQVIIKFVKEVLTLIVNVLFPIIPDGKFESVVLQVRGWVETVDGWVEKGKQALLKVK